ncbi:MAG: DUF4921 family protein [Gammaproteobacteria bacterium]|nr:DUF4921 family protein [Gammaproteobacteria bacterium]
MNNIKIFISHIAEESALAKVFKDRLKLNLEEASKKCNMAANSHEQPEIFVYSDEFEAGHKWMGQLGKALKSADIELILCSPTSVARPWINFEAGAAWVLEIPTIPVCHSGLTVDALPIPLLLLNGIQASQQAGLRQLYTAIAKVLKFDSQFVEKMEFSDLQTDIAEFEEKYVNLVRESARIRARGHAASLAHVPGFDNYGYYDQMADGTVKQTNPFTSTVVWNVPERALQLHKLAASPSGEEFSPHDPEDYCPFCERNYEQTPPEKARIVKREDGYKDEIVRTVEQSMAEVAEFRRIPNLLEAVSWHYWQTNYQLQLTSEQETRKKTYLSTEEGLKHVINSVDKKLELLGKSREEIDDIPEDSKITMSDAFFGGNNELIIPRKHYSNNAETEKDIACSGDMNHEQHYQYFRFSISTMNDIFTNNRYARYISVFQNWLPEGGTSVEHLHRQLIAIDDWGVAIKKELASLRENRNAFNDNAANFAGYHNLVFAENDHAIGFVDIGHRYPTVAIFSKSEHSMLNHLSEKEIGGVSDIVHACHAAMGPHIPSNEEWYYTPIDCLEPIPWHVLIKWRTNNPAGFEGGTRIYLNPVTPRDLRDFLVPRLFELRSQEKIAAFFIATECECKPNSLKYVANTQ